MCFTSNVNTTHVPGGRGARDIHETGRCCVGEWCEVDFVHKSYF